MSSQDHNPQTITLLLQRAKQEDAVALNELFELLKVRLIAIARKHMSKERPDHTLQASALLNEACLKLIQEGVLESATDRRYLLSAANRGMQQILVDHARARNARKRGGDLERNSFDIILDSFESESASSFEALHDALELLGKESPRQREIVEHRYFGGLSIEETAELMNMSPATVKREWRVARATLYAELLPPD